MRRFEREIRLFFEIFGLAALPGMLHAFILSPSVETLPDAYFAVSSYALYRAIVLIRESFEREVESIDEEIEDATDSEEDFDHKP